MMIQSILVILVIVLVTLMLLLVYVNIGSQENYELLKPIVGGVVISLFFVMSYIFAPVPIYESKTNILIVVDQDGGIIPLHNLVPKNIGIKSSDGYMHLWRTSLNFKNKSINTGDGYYVDLVELILLEWISSNFPYHWQIERDEFRGVDLGDELIRIPSDAYKKVTSIKINSLLSGNRFVEFMNKNAGGGSIYLPDGSRAEYKRISVSNHFLTINTGNIILEFNFFGDATFGTFDSELGKRIKTLNLSPSRAYRVRINSKMTVNRMKRWSRLTKQQIEWVESLRNFYKDSFSWENLRSRIEKP